MAVAMGEQDCPTRHHPDRAEHARDVTSIGPEGLYSITQSRHRRPGKLPKICSMQKSSAMHMFFPFFWFYFSHICCTNDVPDELHTTELLTKFTN